MKLSFNELKQLTELLDRALTAAQIQTFNEQKDGSRLEITYARHDKDVVSVFVKIEVE